MRCFKSASPRHASSRKSARAERWQFQGAVEQLPHRASSAAKRV